MESDHPDAPPGRPGAEVRARVEARLTRLHPSSPVFGIARHARALVIPAIFVLFAARGGWASWELWAMVLIVPLALYELLRYATTSYCVEGDRIVVRQGVVFRSERQIPLHRIQNLDLVQNVFHRPLRVAEVRISTAGSAEPEAIFKVLSLDAVARLRREVFPVADDDPVRFPGSVGSHSSGVSSTGSDSTGLDPSGAGSHERVPIDERREELPDGAALASAGRRDGQARSAPFTASVRRGEPLLRIPTSELVMLGLTSDRGMALVAVALGVAWELGLLNRIGFSSLYRQYGAGLSGWTLVFAGAALMITAFLLLRMLSALWMVLRFHGFTLERDGGDLRIRCGLLTRITATIPARRVQLVSLRQTPLQRAMGRTSIRVETAGGVTGDDHAGDHAMLGRRWFVPILPMSELARVLDAVRPKLGAEFDAGRWRPATRAARRRMLRRSLIASCLVAAAALAVAGGLWVGGIFRGSPLVVGAILAFGLLVVPWSLWLTRREAAFLAHAVHEESVFLRSGGWTRQCSATFVDKLQAVALLESPFDRRLGMATVAVDTAGVGPAEHAVRVPMLPRDEAESLRSILADRADRAAFRW